MAHYMTPTTLGDNLRAMILRVDCRQCTLDIIQYQMEYGQPRWMAHKSAHRDHVEGVHNGQN